MDKKTLAGMMDHTLLKATAMPEQIDQVCDEARRIGAASVCVNPCYVERVAKNLAGSGVKTCTVVGFPLGANATAVKAFETAHAVSQGAEEVDMVINIGMLKAGDLEYVAKDIKAVVDAAAGKLVKVIIETCYLTDEEKVAACQCAAAAGADFVKTSTGFGTGGANPQDVALMKSAIPERMKVKASGGMRTLADVLPNLRAGADRLGVSASLAILADLDG
ncbi:MAG: deoxyribose-phosphate aldolase [Christensenellales bacterium]|jgi:deoxyribose-phosphate aldolase